MTPKNKWYVWVIMVGMFCTFGNPVSVCSAVSASSKFNLSCQQPSNFSFDEFTKNKRFHLNTLCTTPYENPDTPAWADILEAPENFVACKGAQIALCYYSGPDDGVLPTPCYLRENEDIADCTCYEIPPGSTYYVDINAILNLDVYLDTVKTCMQDGSECLPKGRKVAPVCEHIRKGTLIPGADLISTFSYVLHKEFPEKFPLAQGQCTEEPPALYAGCMTAPCKRTHVIDPDTGLFLVQCACPIYQGPFQIGTEVPPATCELTEDTVWSAAYATFEGGKTFPDLKCIPDSPNDDGCPLLPQGFKEGDVEVPDDVNCQKVCSEYKKSNHHGIQVGFTCDTTLCTAAGNPAIWVPACAGLDKHPNSEILRLETAVGFSCAASQICGCEPNKKTNKEIWRLNEIQYSEGFYPQCYQNGTLCGTQP